MGYFSYHAMVRRLLREDRLISYYITKRHHHIAPALVLLFDDVKHPVMPIRQERFGEYLPLLPPEKQIDPPV